jgi:uncharacterized protein YmfQ (DUF2313 family)
MSDERHGDPAALDLSWDDATDGAMALLPTGPVWPRDRAGVLYRTVRGLTGVHWQAWRRVHDLLNESDPRTIYETIRMWEIDCGLPDPCLENPPTSIDGRRAAIIAKRQMGATTRPVDFIALADTLGYEIEITEFRPFRTWSECNSFLNTEIAGGDLPPAVPPNPPELPPDQIWRRVGWPHCWLVHVLNEVSIHWMRCDSDCTAFLREWTGWDELRCIFERIKPAHTHILWWAPDRVIRAIWDAGDSLWEDRV